MQPYLSSELTERNKLLRHLFCVKELSMKEKPKKAKQDKQDKKNGVEGEQVRGLVDQLKGVVEQLEMGEEEQATTAGRKGGVVQHGVEGQVTKGKVVKKTKGVVDQLRGVVEKLDIDKKAAKGQNVVQHIVTGKEDSGIAEQLDATQLAREKEERFKVGDKATLDEKGYKDITRTAVSLRQ